jgi:hypothetical protein
MNQSFISGAIAYERGDGSGSSPRALASPSLEGYPNGGVAA